MRETRFRTVLHRSALWGSIAFVVLSLGLPVSARSQVFHAFPGAPVVTDMHPAVGPYISVGDEIFRIGGYGRFNATERMDLGLEVLFDRSHEEWFGGAGGDVRYAIVPTGYEMPFDLSVDAGIGFTTGNDVTQIILPMGGVVSRPIELSPGKALTPYGGVYLLFVHKSVDLPSPLEDVSDWDTEVELRLGSSLTVYGSTQVFASLHLGFETMFFTGLNFGL